MKTFVKVVQDVALLLVRLTFGGLMVLHGISRWQGGISVQTEHLAQAGVPEPQLFAWGAVVLEVLGGVLIAFGILTPLVAAAFLAEFVLVVVWVKWHSGPYLENGGYEYTVALAAIALFLVAFGAGRAGVDNLFRRPRSRTAKADGTVDDNDPA